MTEKVENPTAGGELGGRNENDDKLANAIPPLPSPSTAPPTVTSPPSSSSKEKEEKEGDSCEGSSVPSSGRKEAQEEEANQENKQTSSVSPSASASPSPSPTDSKSVSPSSSSQSVKEEAEGQEEDEEKDEMNENLPLSLRGQQQQKGKQTQAPKRKGKEGEQKSEEEGHGEGEGNEGGGDSSASPSSSSLQKDENEGGQKENDQAAEKEQGDEAQQTTQSVSWWRGQLPTWRETLRTVLKEPLPSSSLLELTEDSQLNALRQGVLDGDEHLTFGDRLKNLVALLAEGRPEGLSDVCGKVAAFLGAPTGGGAVVAIDAAALKDKLPTICSRKWIGCAAKGKKELAALVDSPSAPEEDFGFWCWEADSLQRLPENMRKEFQKTREKRKQVGRKLTCLNRLLTSIESGDLPRVTENREKWREFEKSDEKARLLAQKAEEKKQLQEKKEQERIQREEAKKAKEAEKQAKEAERKEKKAQQEERERQKAQAKAQAEADKQAAAKEKAEKAAEKEKEKASAAAAPQESTKTKAAAVMFRAWLAKGTGGEGAPSGGTGTGVAARPFSSPPAQGDEEGEARGEAQKEIGSGAFSNALPVPAAGGETLQRNAPHAHGDRDGKKGPGRPPKTAPPPMQPPKGTRDVRSFFMKMPPGAPQPGPGKQLGGVQKENLGGALGQGQTVLGDGGNGSVCLGGGIGVCGSDQRFEGDRGSFSVSGPAADDEGGERASSSLQQEGERERGDLCGGDTEETERRESKHQPASRIVIPPPPLPSSLRNSPSFVCYPPDPVPPPVSPSSCQRQPDETAVEGGETEGHQREAENGQSVGREEAEGERDEPMPDALQEEEKGKEAEENGKQQKEEVPPVPASSEEKKTAEGEGGDPKVVNASTSLVSPSDAPKAKNETENGKDVEMGTQEDDQNKPVPPSVSAAASVPSSGGPSSFPPGATQEQAQEQTEKKEPAAPAPQTPPSPSGREDKKKEEGRSSALFSDDGEAEGHEGSSSPDRKKQENGNEEEGEGEKGAVIEIEEDEEGPPSRDYPPGLHALSEEEMEKEREGLADLMTEYIKIFQRGGRRMRQQMRKQMAAHRFFKPMATSSMAAGGEGGDGEGREKREDFSASASASAASSSSSEPKAETGQEGEESDLEEQRLYLNNDDLGLSRTVYIDERRPLSLFPRTAVVSMDERTRPAQWILTDRKFVPQTLEAAKQAAAEAMKEGEEPEAFRGRLGPRRPLARDLYIDYEVDSDEEWEELFGGDDVEMEDEDGADDEDAAAEAEGEGFILPDGCFQPGDLPSDELALGSLFEDLFGGGKRGGGGKHLCRVTVGPSQLLPAVERLESLSPVGFEALMAMRWGDSAALSSVVSSSSPEVVEGEKEGETAGEAEKEETEVDAVKEEQRERAMERETEKAHAEWDGMVEGLKRNGIVSEELDTVCRLFTHGGAIILQDIDTFVEKKKEKKEKEKKEKPPKEAAKDKGKAGGKKDDPECQSGAAPPAAAVGGEGGTAPQQQHQPGGAGRPKKRRKGADAKPIEGPILSEFLKFVTGRVFKKAALAEEFVAKVEESFFSFSSTSSASSSSTSTDSPPDSNSKKPEGGDTEKAEGPVTVLKSAAVNKLTEVAEWKRRTEKETPCWVVKDEFVAQSGVSPEEFEAITRENLRKDLEERRRIRQGKAQMNKEKAQQAQSGTSSASTTASAPSFPAASAVSTADHQRGDGEAESKNAKKRRVTPLPAAPAAPAGAPPACLTFPAAGMSAAAAPSSHLVVTGTGDQSHLAAVTIALAASTAPTTNGDTQEGQPAPLTAAALDPHQLANAIQQLTSALPIPLALPITQLQQQEGSEATQAQGGTQPQPVQPQAAALIQQLQNSIQIIQQGQQAQVPTQQPPVPADTDADMGVGPGSGGDGENKENGSSRAPPQPAPKAKALPTGGIANAPSKPKMKQQGLSGFFQAASSSSSSSAEPKTKKPNNATSANPSPPVPPDPPAAKPSVHAKAKGRPKGSKNKPKDSSSNRNSTGSDAPLSQKVKVLKERNKGASGGEKKARGRPKGKAKTKMTPASKNAPQTSAVPQPTQQQQQTAGSQEEAGKGKEEEQREREDEEKQEEKENIVSSPLQPSNSNEGDEDEDKVRRRKENGKETSMQKEKGETASAVDGEMLLVDSNN